MLPLKLACCVLMVSISACAVEHIKDESSVYYAVPVGSMLTLHQSVTIEGDRVAVYVQDGELKPYNKIYKGRPHCKFEVYKISEQPRTVLPDVFEITRVVDELEVTSMQRSEQLALLDEMTVGNPLMVSMLMFTEVVSYATTMALSSDKQKDVYRLTCQYWGDEVAGKYLSIADMRQAMGDIFSLEIRQ